jgi:hypothetical protein
VLKKPDCFRTTNFILLIVLCWTTVFRTYLYTKLNDRKKITTQYFFSLSSQTKNNFYIFSTIQPFVVTLYILFGYCLYIRIFCIDAKRKQRIEKRVFFSNWNNTQWSQFTVVGVFETFLCGCTCGWYKKESLDSWRGESSGHDPGDTRRRNYLIIPAMWKKNFESALKIQFRS